MFDVATFVQPQVCDLQPYRPGMPIEELARTYNLDPASIIKLASNENPNGASPKARQVLQGALPDVYRYPDGWRLRQALAKKLAITAENVVLGNGSNDILDLVARVFLGKGDESVSSQYAFGVYCLVSKIVGATNVVVSARDFGHDLDAMRAAITAKTRVVWIANPNNPTGTFLSHKEIERFVASVPKEVIVVLDEAYHEYLPPAERTNTVAWIKKYPHIILVRTFSKIYGLAGLRVGYAIAAPEIADMLNRVRQPFNANNLAIVAAVAALADEEFVAMSYRTNQASLKQLCKGLDDLGLSYMPTYGNFVTVKFTDARAVNQALLQRGIIVRPVDEYGLPSYLRITAGLPTENDRLLSAIREILAG